jgi:hypothetical protein
LYDVAPEYVFHDKDTVLVLVVALLLEGSDDVVNGLPPNWA